MFRPQFQSFAQYRGKLGMKSPEEVEALRSCTQVWDVLSVLQCLQSLADTSAVGSLLEAERRGEGSVMSLQEGYDPGSSNVLRVLGYYSLIGLARVHALLGDHAGCLRALDPVELDKPGLFTRVPGAHVTTLYYVGFAYLSSRRHTDAIRTFNAALVYIARHKRQHERAPGYEQIQKKADQSARGWRAASTDRPPTAIALNQSPFTPPPPHTHTCAPLCAAPQCSRCWPSRCPCALRRSCWTTG